jgi:hypothetical protein
VYKLLAVLALSFSPAITAAAQSSTRDTPDRIEVSYARVERPIVERPMASPAAPLCDVNLVQHVRSRRRLGGILILAGIGGAVLGSRATESAGKIYTLVSITEVVGYYLRFVNTGYDRLLVNTVNAVQVGTTTRGQIADCLGSPRMTTSGQAGDVSTWVAANAGLWFISGSARTAAISFRSDVASSIERSAWR